MRGVSSHDQVPNQGAIRAAALCGEAEQALREGAPLAAYDLVAGALLEQPGHVRLRQLMALALARSGASRQANALCLSLQNEGHGDEETLGLLARTHKDLAEAATDPAERHTHWTQAHECYRRAFKSSTGIWSGINVAASALMIGRAEDARQVARTVRDLCVAAFEDVGRRQDYWLLATLGEANLILGDLSEAEQWYRQAVAVGRSRLGDRVATRRNARLILRQAGRPSADLERCFEIPRVVVCVGHLIDRPGRPVPRFPPALEREVVRAVQLQLQALGAGIGFASAACGSDIIALECLRERGAETHVVLPYGRDQFVADSVNLGPEADWTARFDRAIAAATEVITASDHRMGRGDASFEYAFRLLDGSAGVRADELDTEISALAVWNGETGDGAGGTADAVAHWRRTGRGLDVIDLKALLHAGRTGGGISTTPAAERPAGTRYADNPGAHDAAFEPRVVAMLFADVVGFSRLTDAQLPRFVEHYLGLVSRELAAHAAEPLLTNTWGDGIYAVFGDVRAAGNFALRLCDAVRSADWPGLGLPAGLDVRVGLHAGPAYACTDPVTERPNFVGAHVSRAARLEPITPPGQVYASRPFAALARADGVTDFTCVYVGPTPMAKGYGTFPTYVLRAR